MAVLNRAALLMRREIFKQARNLPENLHAGGAYSSREMHSMYVDVVG